MCMSRRPKRGALHRLHNPTGRPGTKRDRETARAARVQLGTRWEKGVEAPTQTSVQFSHMFSLFLLAVQFCCFCCVLRKKPTSSRQKNYTLNKKQQRKKALAHDSLVPKRRRRKTRNETNKKQHSCVHKESEKKFILCTSREGLIAHRKNIFGNFHAGVGFFGSLAFYFGKDGWCATLAIARTNTASAAFIFISFIPAVDSRNSRKRIVYAI